MGSNNAQNELARARREFNRKCPEDAYSYTRENFATMREKAGEYFEANGFRMAGNVSDATRSLIQQELLTAVRMGKSPPQTKADIWDRLVARGLSSRSAVRAVEAESAVLAALDALWLEDEGSANAYLMTLARTNLFEAMNEARFTEFTDPELGDFVTALKFSAILDERTTEVCNDCDGRVFLATSEVWNKWRPPNHYNCRSLLIPITKLDGWNGEESSLPTVEPAEGFA